MVGRTSMLKPTLQQSRE